MLTGVEIEVAGGYVPEKAVRHKELIKLGQPGMCRWLGADPNPFEHGIELAYIVQAAVGLASLPLSTASIKMIIPRPPTHWVTERNRIRLCGAFSGNSIMLSPVEVQPLMLSKNASMGHIPTYR